MTQDAEPQAGTATPSQIRNTGILRLAIGLVQGIFLWWLIRSREGVLADATASGVPPTYHWPASDPAVFLALFMVAALTPPVLLAGAGRMRPIALAVWGLLVAAVLAAIGAWDGLNSVRPEWDSAPQPTPVVMAAAMAMLFVAHHLVQPALARRRWVARYPDYFDVAWKAAVQLALSIGFVGAFWIVLFLGASLFDMIGLSFLKDLIGKDWFSMPITTLTFALAVQLTDVRDGLIRGVRTVGLMLLGWLLPVMTVLAAAFLAALPFTGLSGLWAAGSATGLMLAAAAALIILINAGYHDGDEAPARALRLTMPVAAVLLLPLVALAFLGLGERIGQYGLTPERIIAMACACVGAVYAAGYAWAAIHTWRRRDFMQPLERTNVVAAVAIIVAIIALFTPIADPARLSIGDQLARLHRGSVPPEAFDYSFLKFDSGRQGQRALDVLTRSANTEIARRANEANAAESRYQLGQEGFEGRRQMRPDDVRIEVFGDRPLPPSFVDQYERLLYPLNTCWTNRPCHARILDLDADRTDEVLIQIGSDIHVFEIEADGRWFETAIYETPNCETGGVYDPVAAWRSGEAEAVPSEYPDLVLGGVRLRAQGVVARCPGDTSRERLEDLRRVEPPLLPHDTEPPPVEAANGVAPVSH